MHVIVLGAGVIGVATAWHLREAGCDVTVIEREADVAQATSFGNAGVIAPGYVTPWAAPGMPGKLVKYLFRPASPLIFRPTLDPAQWRWIARWLRECEFERFRANKQRMQRIAYYSRACLHAFREQHPFDYGASRGYLQLLRSAFDVDMVQPALNCCAMPASRFTSSTRPAASRSNRGCAGRGRRPSAASICRTTKPATARASRANCGRSAKRTAWRFASAPTCVRSTSPVGVRAACASRRPVRTAATATLTAMRCSPPMRSSSRSASTVPI